MCCSNPVGKSLVVFVAPHIHMSDDYTFRDNLQGIFFAQRLLSMMVLLEESRGALGGVLGCFHGDHMLLVVDC